MKMQGLYSDGIIWINKDLSETEKNCILAEELGHHFTSYGNILNQDTLLAVKQEKQARAWSYNKLLPFDNICKYYFEAFTIEEFAEYVNVTLEVLSEILDYYIDKYGDLVQHKNFQIRFRPLCVTKIHEDLEE